ncbi:MAG TPA: hypothetical protein DCZ02_02490 [Ruminococcaceae bacterium]|nr:hypothetical protein [Oscillospiraceae bacterium]
MKKIFKKSIACLIAVLMIVTSVPFGGAIVAQAASTEIIFTNGNQCGVLAATGSGNRYDSEKRIITVCNDGQDSNFTIGFATFNVSSLRGKIITGANYDFSLSIAEGREDLGLKIYYPTQNITDFHVSGQQNKTNASIWAGQDGADHIGKAKSYYGLQEIKSFDTVAGNTGTQSVDISEAIQWAVNNGKNNAAICFMLGSQGGIGEQDKNGNSNPQRWSDTLVTLSKISLDVNYRDASALESACINFENKFNSDKIYKNVETAYTAYVNAKKAMIAKNYGASIDETSLANTLNNAVNNMTEWSYTSPNEQIRSTGDSSQSGDDITKRQANVVYQSGTFDVGSPILREVNQNDNTLLFNKTLITTYKIWAAVKIAHANQAVLVYDGINTPAFPVVVQLDRNAQNGPSERAWYGYCTLKSNYTENSGLTFKYPTYWQRTSSGDCTNGDLPYLFNSNQADYTALRSDTDTTRNDGDHSNSDKWFANVVQFTGTMGDNEFSITRNPLWEVYAYNVNNGDNVKYIKLGGTSSSGATDNIYYSSTPLYYINYKVVRTKMSALNSTFANNIKTGKYTQGGALAAAQALDKLTSIDVRGYNYSAGVANAVNSYATAASNAVRAADSAVFTADSVVYDTLCNTVDRNAGTYNAGNNDVYTSASWSAFVTAYDNARNHLKGLANSSFNTAQASNLNAALINAANGLAQLPEYTFVKEDGTSTIVRAENADAAKAKAPALKETTEKTHKDGTEEHIWTEYSWVQTGNTFTETGSENTEACTYGEEQSEVTLEPTCTEKGVKTCNKICTVCNYNKVWTEDIEPNPDNHTYVYTPATVSKHTVTCKEGDLEAATVSHNFDENNTCTDCGMTVDFSTFDAAVATLEAELEKGIYTEESVAQVQEILDDALASKDNCANQDELDVLAASLTEALDLLKRAAYSITFVTDTDGITDVNECEYQYGDVITLDAGTGKVLKWTVEAQNGTTNLGTTAQSIEYVVTRDAVITVYVTQEAESETEKYSKVTFEGHNGAVVAVMYVKEGETLDTSKVVAPAISFYESKGWNKATVTGTGSDITVRAIYKAVGTEKCTVTFGDFRKDYDYDAFVYLKDADENTRYAMYDSKGKLLTYFVGKEFYAPHTDAIVIREATEDTATSAITGYYKDGTKLVYNSKFYLPENTTLVKAGVEVTVDGKTVNFYADKVSARNEFSYAIDFGSLTDVEVKARSFVEYKDADGNTQFAYSEYVTETL